MSRRHNLAIAGNQRSRSIPARFIQDIIFRESDWGLYHRLSMQRNTIPFSALKLSHSSVSVAHEPVIVFAYGIELLETKE